MSTARRQVRLSTEELHQLKQLMGALMALLSFWSLASLDVDSGPVIFLGAVVALAALLSPRWISRIPMTTWKVAGPLILAVILVDFSLNFPEFIPPLVRMVVLLIIYRVLAPRSRREDLQVILLCLFCLVISGVMTVSILFAVQILLFTPLAMALLFLICLLDRGQDSEARLIDWGHFQWTRLVSRVWRVFDLRVVVLSAVMFGFVVTISTLLFILTPRFDLNRAIPFLEMSTQAQSGFSEEVRLGDVSEIQEDNSVALRIDLPSMDALPGEPYWRMLTLDTYGDGRFRASESLQSDPLRRYTEKRSVESDRLAEGDRTGAVWTIYMEGGISRYLPIPGDYATIRFEKFQDVELVDAVNIIALDSVGQNVFSYRVVDLNFNRRFDARESDEPLFGDLGGEATENGPLSYPMTTLELGVDADSASVLRRINEGLLEGERLAAADYSERITDYLWERFNYSLTPDAASSGGRDPIISWLENGSEGHCELFAGAFVLLAREAGYPTRMVVGFAGGSWNPVEDYFLVRNREAHAWVEIFDPEQRNWLRVDPTPGRGSSDPESVSMRDMEFEQGWFAWMDSLRIQWYRRVVNFEQDDQVQLATGVKDAVDRIFGDLKRRLVELGASLKAFAASPFEYDRLRGVLAATLITIAGFVVWRMRFSLLVALRGLLGRRRKLDPVRFAAGRYLRRARQAHADRSIILELQSLRFGPAQPMRLATPVFKRARKAIKRRKKS